MRTASRLALALALAASVVSCNSNDKTDAGGVQITVGNITRVDLASVTSGVAAGEITLPSIILRSLVVNPNGSSEQMDVLIQSYEVTYTRGDGGTQLPTPLVRSFTGALPAGGQLAISQLTILGIEQLNNPPVSNLLITNGGLDRETGKDHMILNVNIRFFGRTIGGRDIVSPNIAFTIELVP